MYHAPYFGWYEFIVTAGDRMRHIKAWVVSHLYTNHSFLHYEADWLGTRNRVPYSVVCLNQ